MINKEDWNQDPRRKEMPVYASHGPRTFSPFSLPSHWHGFFEWLFIEQGEGVARLGQNNEFSVVAGDLIFIHPNTPHSFYSKDGVLIRYLQFHQALLQGIYSSGSPGVKPYNLPALPPCIGADEACSRGWSKLFKSAYDECNDYANGNELSLLNSAAAILCAYSGIAKAYASTGNVRYSNRDLEWLYKLQEYVSTNYSSNICLKDVASRINISPSHLCRLMQKTMGQTFSEYLRQYRMSVAQQLISSDNLTITQIASECGYDDPSAFSRAFRHVMGISPTEYKMFNNLG